VPRVAVVLNPNSGKNRGRDRSAPLRAVLGDRGEVHVTRATEELAPLLERILVDDLACLVSDGGDGALHWALNAALPIVERRGLRLPVMMPTNAGTIDFVARKAGVRGDAQTLLARLVAALDRGAVPVVELDSLEVEGTLRDGSRARWIGFAMAAGGVGNRFFDKLYAEPELGPASIMKVVAKAVASLPFRGAYARDVFRPHRARVSIDGALVPTTEHGALHAGAFDVDLGGVFRVFPLAREPGAIQFQAGAITPWQIVANLPQLALGRAIRSDAMRDQRGSVMEIEALEEPLAPVIDGEIYRDVMRLVIRKGPLVRVARV
jgi:diacylglycerol kinase family enzyme